MLTTGDGLISPVVSPKQEAMRLYPPRNTPVQCCICIGWFVPVSAAMDGVAPWSRYREILKTAGAFAWADDHGRPWDGEIARSARREFEDWAGAFLLHPASDPSKNTEFFNLVWCNLEMRVLFCCGNAGERDPELIATRMMVCKQTRAPQVLPSADRADGMGLFGGDWFGRLHGTA